MPMRRNSWRDPESAVTPFSHQTYRCIMPRARSKCIAIGRVFAIVSVSVSASLCVSVSVSSVNVCVSVSDFQHKSSVGKMGNYNITCMCGDKITIYYAYLLRNDT